MATRHRHNFQAHSWQGKPDQRTVTFKCRCGEEKTRDCTPEETLRSPGVKLDENPHETWHALQKLLPEGWQEERGQHAKGEIVNALEAFVAKYPTEVMISGCDDSYFCSSDIVLATHESENSFMGTTVLMFPQCDNRPPAEFFLYAGHLDELIKNLTAIRSRSNAKWKIEKKARREWISWWNKRGNAND